MCPHCGGRVELLQADDGSLVAVCLRCRMGFKPSSYFPLGGDSQKKSTVFDFAETVVNLIPSGGRFE